MKGLRPGWAVKAIVAVIFASTLFRCVSAATNHSVGGASGWDLSSNLQAWATQATFHVGDSLVFTYTPVHDVLEVRRMEYELCRTVNPIETYNEGETVIPLEEEGSRYFMCGRPGHCAMGLKLHVQVLPPLPIASTSPSPLPSTASTSRRRSPPSPRRRPPPPPRHHDTPDIPDIPDLPVNNITSPPPAALACPNSVDQTTWQLGVLLLLSPLVTMLLLLLQLSSFPLSPP